MDTGQRIIQTLRAFRRAVLVDASEKFKDASTKIGIKMNRNVQKSAMESVHQKTIYIYEGFSVLLGGVFRGLNRPPG